ncbi:hypothetical protein AB6A40_001581 [Gnathostoma spinigerum]|uniref:Uncharacterized protein n=1 Tax=Gnathostoma spinigerum TaxID=75299 RepID=A0ABD6EED8_9BILA
MAFDHNSVCIINALSLCPHYEEMYPVIYCPAFENRLAIAYPKIAFDLSPHKHSTVDTNEIEHQPRELKKFTDAPIPNATICLIGQSYLILKQSGSCTEKENPG